MEFAGRAFVIEGAQVTLRDLTLLNGSGPILGGGALLLQAKADVEIRDCVLEGNVAIGLSGGAVRVRGGAQVSLRGCILSNNVAGFGGALAGG